MTLAPPKRPAAGYADVAAHLRDWIVRGDLAPGTPLPKQTELCALFQVSGPTLGRAMRELQDDGFVVAIRRAGSFVADGAPHLHRYGLVLPPEGRPDRENRYLLALSREAARIHARGGRELVCYPGVGYGDSPGRRALEADLERRRLAGLIFATTPFPLQGRPALTLPGLPRVALTDNRDAFPTVATVSMPPVDFARRAMQRLAALGRRRLAVLAHVNALELWSTLCRELPGAYGLELRPEWLQACHIDSAVVGRQIMRLLLSGPADSRPDAVIITDDNLVKEATTGIAASGVATPAALSVVVHCNFPWPTPAEVPVIRLGFDAAEMLERCLALLAGQQRGESPPPAGVVSAIFEDEYDARRAAP